MSDLQKSAQQALNDAVAGGAGEAKLIERRAQDAATSVVKRNAKWVVLGVLVIVVVFGIWAIL